MRHRTSILERPRTRLASAWIAGATAASLALLAGCGGSEEPAAPEASETPAAERSAPPAQAERRPAAPARDEGELVRGELPESYPSDLPIYPNATPATSLAVPGGGMLVTLDSSDSAQVISEHFRTELESNGWSIVNYAVGDLKASKEGRNVRITATEQSDGPTRIAIGTTATKESR